MIGNLQQIGNSRALVLDKALLESIGLGESASVQIVVSGNSLIIMPPKLTFLATIFGNQL